ncbi:MAG: hypothetical protein ACYS9X_26990 [Planctomycetota bacterium]|jgi:ribosome-binding protein aMBF1 (putative translation factor)
MPQEIRYCDQCGRMVQQDEANMAIVTSRVAVCASCAARLTPEQRSRLSPAAVQPAAGPALPSITPAPRRPAPGRQPAADVAGRPDDAQPARAPTRRPQTRAMRRAQAAERAAETPTQRNAIMMAVGAGVFLAIVVLLWMLLSDSGKEGKPAGGGARPARQSEYARTLEIQEKLRKFMATARASTSAYEKTRPALVKFVNDHRNRQEAVAARQFIKQMDHDYELMTGKSVLEAVLPAPAPAPDAE